MLRCALQKSAVQHHTQFYPAWATISGAIRSSASAFFKLPANREGTIRADLHHSWQRNCKIGAMATEIGRFPTVPFLARRGISAKSFGKSARQGGAPSLNGCADLNRMF